MRRGLLCFLLVSFSVLLSSVPAARVQPVAPAPPIRGAPGLQSITNRAGLIFSGTVVLVERVRASRPNQIEAVEISFRVEQPVRGVSSGQILRIREWGGLWIGRPRYQVGQRLMMFLYPPSKLGLTSPVPAWEICRWIARAGSAPRPDKRKCWMRAGCSRACRCAAGELLCGTSRASCGTTQPSEPWNTIKTPVTGGACTCCAQR